MKRVTRYKSAAAGNKTACKSANDGYSCTRPAKHRRGPHVAHGIYQQEVARWDTDGHLDQSHRQRTAADRLAMLRDRLANVQHEQARQSEFAGLRLGVFTKLKELEREERKIQRQIDRAADAVQKQETDHGT